MEFYLWMDGCTCYLLGVRSIACEGSCTWSWSWAYEVILTKGDNNLTKLNEKTSCICEKAVQTCNSYGSGWELHITGELLFLFLYFWKEILRISSITSEKIIATLFSHIITHNNLDSNSAFCYPQVSSLRFEHFSHQTQNLGRAQGCNWA